MFVQFSELANDFYSKDLPSNLLEEEILAWIMGEVKIAMVAHYSELQFLTNHVMNHVQSNFYTAFIWSLIKIGPWHSGAKAQA